jgi:predicted transposase/invertase (TIGR01784 family)
MLEKAIERQRQTWLQQGLQQGLEQGLEQGLRRGIDQGLQQGLEQGLKLVDQEKQKIAKALLANGMDLTWIAEITGLSVEQLWSLWQTMGEPHALSS